MALWNPLWKTPARRVALRAFVALALAGALQILPLALGRSAWAADAAVSGAAPAAPAGQAAETAPDETEDSHLAPCPANMGASAAGTALAPVSPATAALIREHLKKRLGVPSSICRTPFGLYEVIVDGDLFYVDEHANYLLAGNAFDLRSQENLTAPRKDEALRIDFKTLPLQLAVKTVHGDGTRVLAVFEDPNCPYCKHFEKDMTSLTNTTIYTFLYPILSRDAKLPDDSYPKAKAIWCAPDRGAAWAQLMLQGRRLEAAPDSCKHPLEEILALGQKLHIVGTPTLLFTDGRRAPGAIPVDRVEKMLADAARSTKLQ